MERRPVGRCPQRSGSCPSSPRGNPSHYIPNLELRAPGEMVVSRPQTGYQEARPHRGLRLDPGLWKILLSRFIDYKSEIKGERRWTAPTSGPGAGNPVEYKDFRGREFLVPGAGPNVTFELVRGFLMPGIRAHRTID